MRFLVTADLHIQKADRLPLLERLLRLGEEKGCDALLIGGDLLDSPFPEEAVEVAIPRLFAAWKKPIFLVAGNHDPLALTALFKKMPENVTLFPEALTAFSLGKNLRLYGYSAKREQSTKNPLAGLRIPQGEVAILLGHSHFQGTDFQPVHPEELANSGLALAILGHIHKGEQRRIGATRLLVPGIPEGRGWDETGEKYVYILDADDEGRIMLEPCSIAQVRYREQEVDLSDCKSAEEIFGRMEAHLPSADTRLRLILSGESGEEAEIAARLFSQRHEMEVLNRTIPRLPLEALREQNTLQGHFIRRAMEEIEAASPAERPLLEEALRLGLLAMKEARL